MGSAMANAPSCLEVTQIDPEHTIPVEGVRVGARGRRLHVSPRASEASTW